MKIYCSCCDKVQPVRIDNCRDAKTNEPFQDIVCAECDLVIASGIDIVPPERGPVAWLITDEKINSLQVDSIQRLIDRARHAHMTDIKLRINGQDEWHQADWLKYLTRTTPPQRKPLTDEQIIQIASTPDGSQATTKGYVIPFARAIEAAHGIKE